MDTTARRAKGDCALEQKEIVRVACGAVQCGAVWCGGVMSGVVRCGVMVSLECGVVSCQVCDNEGKSEQVNSRGAI